MLFYVNFFYHFCRFNQSLLMEDLMGIPVKAIKPIYKITKYECDLYKEHTVYESMKAIKQEAIDDYNILLLSTIKINLFLFKKPFYMKK